MNIYDFIIDEDDPEAVVMDFNSFVSNPAHGKRMIAFNKQDQVRYSFNEKERVVMGVLIAADVPIYRRDGNFEYFGIFRKDTITKIKERLMKQGFIHNLNVEHNPKSVVKGAFMTDIFQIDAKKGITVPEPLSDQNLADGTLIALYKIEDQKLWSDVEAGKFSGFSIEAYLDIKEANVKKANKMSKPKVNLWGLFKSAAEKQGVKFDGDSTDDAVQFAKGTTADGVVVMWDGELSEGTAMFIEANGQQTPAPEGVHEVTMEDGTVKVITLDASGMVASIEEVEPMGAEEILSQVAEVMAATIAPLNTEITALKAENEELKTRLSAIETGKGSKFNNSGQKPAGGGDNTPGWKKITQQTNA